MSGDNPFICDDGTYPIQSTVSRCQQCLSLFHNLFWTGDDQAVALDFDDRCAFLAVVEGIDDALKHVVNELDGYQPKDQKAEN